MKTVKITLNEVEWHVPPERPEKAGTYWAVSRWLDLSEWNYTPEGGWNTHYNEDGLYTDSALPDDRITAWTYAAPLTVEVSDV